MTEPCELCATQVKPMQTYIGSAPSRLIWVEQTAAARPENNWLETWTRHTAERCREARPAPVQTSLDATTKRQESRMAQIREVHLIDDLDGGPADETVQFALEGKRYEADLSSANAKQLREHLAPYVAAARQASISTRPASSSKRSSQDREHNTAVRAWAREHGISIGDRGRIPQIVTLAHAEGRPEIARGVTT